MTNEMRPAMPVMMTPFEVQAAQEFSLPPRASVSPDRDEPDRPRTRKPRSDRHRVDEMPTLTVAEAIELAGLIAAHPVLAKVLK